MYKHLVPTAFHLAILLCMGCSDSGFHLVDFVEVSPLRGGAAGRVFLVDESDARVLYDALVRNARPNVELDPSIEIILPPFAYEVVFVNHDGTTIEREVSLDAVTICESRRPGNTFACPSKEASERIVAIIDKYVSEPVDLTEEHDEQRSEFKLPDLVPSPLLLRNDQ
jgi:hypothetical protein